MTQFVIDEQGNRTAVLMDIQQYNELIEAIEELDDIHSFDEALASTEKPVPLDHALSEIEKRRPK